MTETYKQANISHSDDILCAMAECFKETQKVISFFFEEKRLLIDNCYICEIDNKIVSLINIIDSKLKLNNTILKGAYVYGACTLEKYRNQGYMSNLLKYIQKVCSKKNYDCLFLSPANPKLELFYQKLGYTNFFKIKKVILENSQMFQMITSQNSYNKNIAEYNLNLDNIEKFRDAIYGSDNYVIYNHNDIEFAIKMYTKFSKGKIIYSKHGYGICVCTPSNELKIIDFTCKNTKETIKLLEKIYRTFPHQNRYIIETSSNNTFFESFGNTCYNGMILPLTKHCKNVISESHLLRNAYLGISLE